MPVMPVRRHTAGMSRLPRWRSMRRPNISVSSSARSPFDPSIEVVINDATYFCLIPQLTAVRTESLGRVVTTLAALEYEIKRAIDRMFGGW